MILALIGGMIGITLGSGIAWIIAYFAKWEFVVTPESVLAAALTSAAVGIFLAFIRPERLRCSIRLSVSATSKNRLWTRSNRRQSFTIPGLQVSLSGHL